jgi:hypothetical protein
LTTDDAGLGVGVRGSGCSGFTAAHARADDDENMRLRPPPRMALPERLQLLPSSSPSPPSDFWWRRRIRGKSLRRWRGTRGRLVGGATYRVAARVGKLESGRRGCSVEARVGHPRLPTLLGAAAMGLARCSRHLPAPRHRHGKRLRNGKRIQGRG